MDTVQTENQELENPLVSYHVFFFPFRWDFVNSDENLIDTTFEKRTNISNFVGQLDKGQWKGFSDHENTPIAFYNDALFFYDAVRKTVFGDIHANDNSTNITEDNIIVKNLTFNNPSDKLLTYSICTKRHGDFQLNIDRIRLNIYSSGVGIISFYLLNNNEKHADPESILRINDYGRRLFPTFLTFSSNNSESLLTDPQEDASLPLKIVIGEKDSNNPFFEESFQAFEKIQDKIKHQPNNLLNGSQKLLDAFLGFGFVLEANRDKTKEQIIVRPTLDDRMFAVCWYGNNKESRKLAWNSESKSYGFQDHAQSSYWMRFLFMESGSGSTQSRLTRQELSAKHTYYRWADYGTLYGVTRSTFVCLTDEDEYAKNTISRHMHRLYAEMVQLVLTQHACTLRYSDEVALLQKKSKGFLLKSGTVHFVYERYLEFSNHINHRVVTPTEQGHELYLQLQAAMDIEPIIAKMDRDVAEFMNLVNHLEEAERNRMSTWFSFLATIFLPASTVAAIFGMSSINETFHIFGNEVYWEFWYTLIIIFLSGIAGYFYMKRKIDFTVIFPKKNTNK